MSIETKLVKYYNQECTRIKIAHTCNDYEEWLIEKLKTYYRFNFFHRLVAYRKTARYKYYYFAGNIIDWYENLKGGDKK